MDWRGAGCGSWKHRKSLRCSSDLPFMMPSPLIRTDFATISPLHMPARVAPMVRKIVFIVYEIVPTLESFGVDWGLWVGEGFGLLIVVNGFEFKLKAQIVWNLLRACGEFGDGVITWYWILSLGLCKLHGINSSTFHDELTLFSSSEKFDSGVALSSRWWSSIQRFVKLNTNGSYRDAGNCMGVEVCCELVTVLGWPNLWALGREAAPFS